MTLKELLFFLIATAIGSKRCFAATKYAEDIRSPIFEGFYAKPNQMTFEVGIMYDNRILCGGSLITYKHVITAAHCIKHEKMRNPKFMSVIAGTKHLHKGGVEIPAAKLIAHPNFTIDTRMSDIGMIILKYAFQPSKHITRIPLPTKPVTNGEFATIGGFGAISKMVFENRLKYYNTRVFDSETCKQMYLTVPNRTENVTDSDICEVPPKRGTGVCFGDSGSPLVNKKSELIGIASRLEDCADGYPVIYASVYYHLDFIKEIMKID